jgi:SCY1-like protein 2
MAALDVFKATSNQVDSDFLAMDVLPILWQFSLGPLLNLSQFQAYMTLIKSMSVRIESEQTRKLNELGANTSTATTRNEFMSFSGGPSTTNGFDTSNGAETDFEALVRGGQQAQSSGTDMLGGDTWANASLPSRPPANRSRSGNASPAATFAWSTPPISPAPNSTLTAPNPQSRAITPDTTFTSLNSSFPAMAPSNPGIGSPAFAAPSQQQQRPNMSMNSMASALPATSYTTPSSTIDWTKASNPNSTYPTTTSNFSIPPPPQTSTPNYSQTSTPNYTQPSTSKPNTYSVFTIPPPKPASNTSFSIAPPPMGSRTGSALRAQTQGQQRQQQQQQWGSGGDSLI